MEDWVSKEQLAQGFYATARRPQRVCGVTQCDRYTNLKIKSCVHLKPNTRRRRRRDATVELSHVGGVYWALTACILCAVVASDNADREPRASRRLLEASLVFSFIGLIAGISYITITTLAEIYGYDIKHLRN